ncbi:MAG: hypothetical protein GX409_02305 [candidate division Zixibacteria bacterium]|nr:hypothetical protein [candidate division Zixibacteria bacterium]
MSEQFIPFRMPDLAGRSEGQSKTLKDSYIYLRMMGFPDRDIFIYPEGEFENFKGEIIKQKPEAGELVYPGDKIFIVAAVTGISELMPDLFTDHIDDLFEDDFNARQGARRLFAIFDSIVLKMQCRLEWIRDIYAGIYQSESLIEYLSKLSAMPEQDLPKIPEQALGYILPRLYGYLATEQALQVYLKTVMGLSCDCSTADSQWFPMPERARCALGRKGRLGEDYYIGDRFKGIYPSLNVDLAIDKLTDIKKIIPGGTDSELLISILRVCMPAQAENYTLNIKPHGDKLIFESGDAYLGYNTILTEKTNKSD